MPVVANPVEMSGGLWSAVAFPAPGALGKGRRGGIPSGGGRRWADPLEALPGGVQTGASQKGVLGQGAMLCAQALCLEEMLGIEVIRGALFYGKPRRRAEVIFDPGLRLETAKTARRLP